MWMGWVEHYQLLKVFSPEMKCQITSEFGAHHHSFIFSFSMQNHRHNPGSSVVSGYSAMAPSNLINFKRLRDEQNQNFQGLLKMFSFWFIWFNDVNSSITLAKVEAYQRIGEWWWAAERQQVLGKSGKGRRESIEHKTNKNPVKIIRWKKN